MTPIQSQKYGFRILEILFGCFLVLATMFLIKDVETKFLPVIKNFEVHHAIKTDEGIELRGTMQKVRSCTFNDMMIYVDSEHTSYPVAVDYRFYDPASGLTTRHQLSKNGVPG